METKKVLLTILDGWGLGQDPKVSALAQANTPVMDRLMQEYPHATLEASGLAVGLPAGQMGNSEVGHMNLGAGRVVYQNLVKLNMAVEQGTLGKEPVISAAFQYAKEHGKKVHFIGLVSDGGVHSHIRHLEGLLQAAGEFGIGTQCVVHAFTDGRDCDPHSGAGFVAEAVEAASKIGAVVGSVVGRYYAMDRDRRWERIKVAYDAMVHGIGEPALDLVQKIKESYQKEVTDEFLQPIVNTACINEQGENTSLISAGDVVISFNFRTDRGREITEVLTQQAFPEYDMQPLDLYYVTLTNYDKSFKNVHVVFDDQTLPMTLGEVLQNAGKTQVRAAETEKYPHVTFFFSGGQEKEFSGESRILCPSPKDVPTYDLKPQMSAGDITDRIIPVIQQDAPDFICLNYANTDMVGHTGVFSAAVAAAEAVDQCLGRLVAAALEKNYTVMVLADHGNSDVMINPDGSPNTQHSTNLVPFIVADNNHRFKVTDGKLGDVAPSILHVMGISIPTEMSGNIIVEF